MPGKIKVKVLAGRNLPVMDRAGDTTDAFVEIRFGGVTHKTDVCRKSLNPHWSTTEWYRFEVDESELQDEPLQLRLMDHDTYSANDAIGKVVISLAPLVAKEANNMRRAAQPAGAIMSGWIPVFDTMHGIRGELNIIVKVELFTDFNKYKNSSCGVQFFHCSMIPPGYRATAIHGFVEELVVNDDPEYQWIDKIRTPRASNEARQVAFIKLSNQVQRLVGVKAAVMGANAVVGYQQNFDLEGEAGVVARAIGTAISLAPLPGANQPISLPACTQQSEMEKELAYEREKEMESPPRHSRHDSCGGREQLPPTLQQMHGSFNSTSTPVGIHRRSSDSDLSVTPKGGSLNTSNSNAGSGLFRPSVNRSNLEMLEYPFLTMTEYPPGFILHLGGTVCSRSVKLLDGAGDNVTRDAWWAELRTEVRSHARALRCNAVVAYSEECNIWEDVCVLSVIGTAALINLNHEFNADGDQTIGSDSEDDTPQESEPAEPAEKDSEDDTPQESEPAEPAEKGSKTTLDESEPDSCLLAHVPYSTGTEPDMAELCGGCRKARVPAVLLATCSKPRNLPAYSKAITLTAVAARLRRAPPTSEAGARDVSDQLPFLEYELHKLLVAKLRMQGANALFSLQTQLTMGERYVIALASGTAVRLLHLPPPTPPTVKTSQNETDSVEIQMALWDAFTANQASNGYDIEMTLPEPPPPVNTSQESEPEELPVLDLCADKDAFVLELDEAEEVESAKALAIRRTHMQVYTSDVKSAPNSPPQAFAQVWRSRLTVNMSGGASGAAERHVTRAMDGVAYKLRRLQPCAIMPRFQIELPEDEIQLVVWGAAIPLLDPNKAEHTATSEHSQDNSNESHTQSTNSNKHFDTTHSPFFMSQSSYNSNSQSQSRSNESGSTESDSSHSNSSGSTAGGRDVIQQQEIPPNVTSDDDDIFALDEDQHTHSAGISQPTETYDDKMLVANGPAPTAVSLTTLPHVSGARATRRLCALRLLFVRETTAVRELGGLSGFLHTFTCEALAIARAYTAALGGNALTSFYINQLMLQDNTHKNQGQCLLSVGGDVVHVTF